MYEPSKPFLKKCATKETQKIHLEKFFFDLDEKELQIARKDFLEDNPSDCNSEEEFMEYMRDCNMLPFSRAKKNLSLQDLIEYLPKGVSLDQFIFSFNGKDMFDYCDDIFLFERKIKRTPEEVKDLNAKYLAQFQQELKEYKDKMQTYKKYVEKDAIQSKKDQLRKLNESAKKLAQEIEQMENGK